MASHQNLQPFAFTPGNSRKQSYLPLKIATWNVRTLNTGENGVDKGDQLSSDLERYGIDLCCISEVRRPGSGISAVGKSWHLAYSGSRKGLRKYGVGIMMSTYAKSSLLDTQFLSDRLMKVVFKW